MLDVLTSTGSLSVIVRRLLGFLSHLIRSLYHPLGLALCVFSRRS